MAAQHMFQGTHSSQGGCKLLAYLFSDSPAHAVPAPHKPGERTGSPRHPLTQTPLSQYRLQATVLVLAKVTPQWPEQQRLSMLKVARWASWAAKPIILLCTCLSEPSRRQTTLPQSSHCDLWMAEGIGALQGPGKLSFPPSSPNTPPSWANTTPTVQKDTQNYKWLPCAHPPPSFTHSFKGDATEESTQDHSEQMWVKLPDLSGDKSITALHHSFSS